MGSQSVQGALWGKQPENWAIIQEKTGVPGYEHAIDTLHPGAHDHLLDVGCGSGMFCDIVHRTGAQVTGIDASPPLIDLARKRNPLIQFLVGEMEELPFDDNHFTMACGFNSFQYAANVVHAFTEAKRVLKPGGRLIAMIWGNKEECEAAAYLKAVGSTLPPPLPGAPGPFALTENHLLEKNLEEAGFTIIAGTDVPAVWDYESSAIALKGLLSAGPAARAIDHSGYQKVHDAVAASIAPFTTDTGRVIFKNKFRIVLAGK